MPYRGILEEQRRSQRVVVNMRAHYSSSTLDLEGQVSNLSRSGMFLKSEYLDDEGSQVAVELEVAGHPLRLHGEVAWVDLRPLRSGMGIRFAELDPEVMRTLANLVIEGRYPPPAV